MSYNRIVLVSIAYLSMSFTGESRAATIALQLVPYPEVSDYQLQQLKKLSQPGKIAKRNLQSLTSISTIVGGILTTYAGYLQVSDLNGLITFPRSHAANKLFLLMTRHITPITMFGQTIHHWEISSGSPAELFLIEKKTDESTQSTFFQVTSHPLPENNEIPLECLVLITKPSRVYVPLGITLTAAQNPNLTLPDIYIKKGSRVVDNSLFLLNLTHLFRPVEFKYQVEPTRYSAQFID